MCCTTNVAIIAVDGGFVNHVSACLKGVADYWGSLGRGSGIRERASEAVQRDRAQITAFDNDHRLQVQYFGSGTKEKRAGIKSSTLHGERYGGACGTNAVCDIIISGPHCQSNEALCQV